MEPMGREASAREPIRLLTISREYGAGGSELGVLLGERLGWRVMDQEVAGRIARRLRCEESDVRALDEHAPSLLERLVASFAVTAPDAAELPTPVAAPDPDRLVEATREVLLEAARELPLIVVGHGGNILYRDRPDVLRLRVAAPFEVRVQRVARRTGLEPHQAARDVRYRDADRQHYLQRYYHVDAADPHNYDLILNTGTFSLERAADLIEAAVRGCG
ncbi:MAG TPA: cytidylate kinase-like family protein [Gemmatimonadales bacterium]|nr:cytidylate kinase-like family protein [Gemmatimonadales bacterium]